MRFLRKLGTVLCTIAFGLIVAGMTFGWLLWTVRQ
jgi:hypothetical protein